ncbi:hypothetical protein CA951_02835 [Rhodococcus sp. NCIMB 12038]|nr:hypothetical protein CA951_02835 [Rhodococcus sp. NCIMB 12038]
MPTSQVPTDPGVHVVLRVSETDPEFRQVSPAGWFKRKDPSVPVATLEDSWVPGSPVVYLGKANGGATGRRGLRMRLDEYRRHGTGEPIGHWGGRYIWQLADSDELVVGWKPTADTNARALKRHLIAEFSSDHAKRPFANLTG